MDKGLQVGNIVRVLAPFTEAYPDTYEVIYVKDDKVCGICDDRDFDQKYVELINDSIEEA